MTELELNGIPGAALNVVLVTAPPVLSAPERGEWMELAGRDGSVWQSDGGLEMMDLQLQLYIGSDADISAALDWIRSAETLRFSTQAWAYRVASADASFKAEPWLDMEGEGWLIKAEFQVQPYRYAWPQVPAIPMTSGQSLTNRYTAAAEPVITVRGTGSVILYVGDYTAAVADLSGGIVMDCAALQATDYADGSLRTAELVLSGSGRRRWPRLERGSNIIRWVGDGVTSVTIAPMWRDR